MALATSGTVNGISYSYGSTFTARVSATGKAASDGTGSSSSITKGSTYSFLYYNAGASYPYAIGTGSSKTVRCWVKAAVFPYATYTVKYSANGGSGAPSSQTKTYGTSLTLSSTKPTRTGYTFQGWATSSSGSVAYAAGGTYTANAAITLYAVWKINTYTVSYNANGGSGAPSSQTKTYGVALTLSSTKPTRTGYTFQGWATSSSGSVAYSAGGSYTNNAAVTLYAVWQINTYTVSYNANGGSGAPSSQTKTYGVTLTLSSTKPARTGYTFKGWATSSSGSVAYASGASYTANAAVTLYAVWQINTYTVSYNANGGSGAPSSQTKTYGVTLALSSVIPTRTEYTFKGWATSSSGSVAYAAGANYTANAAVTLYAVWEINSYTVTFDANGGSGSTAKSVNYGSAIGTLPEASKDYYSFAGWFTAAEGGTQITSSTIVTAAVTYYAQYVIDASIHIHNGTEFVPGFPYVYTDGGWKKGYAYVHDGTGWKQGVG